MTTPYTPMLSRDGTCLRMPDGSFERLDNLPRYQPMPAAPAPTVVAPTHTPTAAVPVPVPVIKTNTPKE